MNGFKLLDKMIFYVNNIVARKLDLAFGIYISIFPAAMEIDYVKVFHRVE